MRIMDFWPFDNYLTLKQVIVNTRTDKAFRGVLWKKRRNYLVVLLTALPIRKLYQI